ncbi:N-acetylmuramic acid 6-phosphate etherase 1 [Bienertia sinuspersici]
MDTISSLSSFPPISLSSTNSSSNTQTRLINPSVKSSIKFNSEFRYSNYIKLRQLKVRVKAVDDVSRAIGDPSQAQLSWEIVVGALAGVVPFIVAGIEFSKRIGVFYRGNLGEDSFRGNLVGDLH